MYPIGREQLTASPKMNALKIYCMRDDMSEGGEKYYEADSHYSAYCEPVRMRCR